MNNHPDWIRALMPETAAFNETTATLNRQKLATVCQEAHCPNIGECFRNHTATFLILGRTCTRNCTFCSVTQHARNADPPDPDEPRRLGEAAVELGLAHVVITSVTRDDLADGGASHFAACVRAVRELSPQSTVEVLIPDFQGARDALATVLASKVDVLNHNIETVPGLYPDVRPLAGYWRSLRLLAAARELDPGARTKSGLMLGLGETPDELRSALWDLREADCDILTLGQYLRPSSGKHRVVRYVDPAEFEDWKQEAIGMGFKYVESGPLVRSSYHAWKQL